MIVNKVIRRPVLDASKQPRVLPPQKPARTEPPKRPCGFCKEVREKVKGGLQYLGVKL